jgi:hypothetical protein
MGPLVIGLGGAALWLFLDSRRKTPAPTTLAASAASPSTLAAGAQMLFRDYQWTVLVPSLTDVSRFLSPPPGATIGSGKWWRYPGGYATGPWGPLRGGANAPHSLAPVGASHGGVVATSARPRVPVSPPAGGASPQGTPPQGTPPQVVGAPHAPRKIVQVPDWGGVPITSCIYAWRPNTGTSQALNGYLVYGTSEWYVGLDASAMSQDSDALVTGKGSGLSGFLLYVQSLPPPPAPTPGTPAATVVANAGKGAAWVLKHPGLLVWIGASNANEADLQALSAPVTMSSASAVPQVPAAGAQTALPVTS